MSPENPRVALARSIGTRIGEGLQECGVLAEEPMRRTLDAVRSHVGSIRAHYIKLSVIATSALRRAHNGEDFAARVRDIVGTTLHVLTGDEEAAASYRGAVTALGTVDGERAGVADIGGGSSEYAIGIGTHAQRTISCEIGAVRLTESLPALGGHSGTVDGETLERARGMASEILAPLRDFEKIEKLAFVGGTATTVASIVRGKRSSVERCEVSRDELSQTLTRLCSLDSNARKAVTGMKPQRADILPAGIILLQTVMELVECDRAIATTADLLLGYLLTQRDATPIPGQAHSYRGTSRTPGAVPRR